MPLVFSSLAFALLLLLSSASTWIYVDGLLIVPQQEAARHRDESLNSSLRSIAHSYRYAVITTHQCSRTQSTQLLVSSQQSAPVTTGSDTDETRKLLEQRKRSLLILLGADTKTAIVDPVLASPKTKRPFFLATASASLEGSPGVRVKLTTAQEESFGPGKEVYTGRTDTFYNLLTEERTEESGPVAEDETATEQQIGQVTKTLLNAARVFIPPPVRGALATFGIMEDDAYVPMRDLFTSPAVSFAYERGWRQGFAAAGFPGIDAEFELVKEYFEPTAEGSKDKTVVVDMSCATGLMTRRLAKSGLYDRVIGCDYSESMLLEARRRIRADKELSSEKSTRLDLVRCDVAQIPMRTESVNAVHAGAAMHCWPEIELGLAEIYRVLKPGGRYFATTFLSEYFRVIQTGEGGRRGPERQSFQYFESKEQLRDMMLAAGFEEENVSVEVLGRACVVIRCEK